MPIVSVCLPTYEPDPAYLKAAIESVLAQTFTDWELIIHDDASKKDVIEVVRPFLSDPRIRFHRSDVRLRIGGNWNACAWMGSAPFVAYMFQDDLWHPDYLQRSLEVLQREQDVGFTAADHTYLIEGSTAASSTGIYGEVDALRKSQMTEGRIHREAFLTAWIERGLRPNLIGEPSFVVLRRSLMEEVGPFLEDMKQGLDAEYWVRCLLRTDGWWLAGSLGEFRVHAAAATAKNEESGAGKADRLRIFRSLAKALPPGPMKTLAKRKLRWEFLGMMAKFFVRAAALRGRGTRR
ncbi:glycosyltransferase [Candidatus Peribacteria bacterium]|nr:glycosyltransferase [Candidatus Peribacteria bacterium]